MTDCNIPNFDQDKQILSNSKIIIQLFEQLGWPKTLNNIIRDNPSIYRLRMAIMIIVNMAKRQKKQYIIDILRERNLLVNSSRPGENIKWQEEYSKSENVVIG
jgi:hypothetical protein